jgi:hypothetical protein
MQKGRSDGRCGLEALPDAIGEIQLLSSSPEEDEPEELSPPKGPHDGVLLGAAQLGTTGAGAGGGAATGAAAGAAFFFAGLFLALAFLADFFGAAALAFLADFFAAFFATFFADFLAFLAGFFADFLADFFEDFFVAVSSFLFFLLFLPPFFFLPLAIVILLLPPINVHRAFQVVRREGEARRSVQSWPGTACRPIEKLNRVHHRN